MSRYGPGSQLRLTEGTHDLVTIWSQAPGVSRFWCHLEDEQGRRMVLVRIQNRKDSLTPLVTLVEE